jgi:IS5 family transposase
MRKKRISQASIFEYYGEHETARHLRAISTRLDGLPDILDLAFADLVKPETDETGSEGLSVESVVRAALLKQMMGLSYEELSFYLEDSLTYRSFSRIHKKTPSASSLQSVISAISAETWEKINRLLLKDVADAGIEKARTVRIDSTVTASNIHSPTDSSLLWDSVRIMTRILEQLREQLGKEKIVFCDHQRLAKKRMRAIVYTRKKEKKADLYKVLVETTQKTFAYLQDAQTVLNNTAKTNLQLMALHDQIILYTPLIESIIDQTQRRVFKGESVPVSDKVVSLFEPHTDIIVKGSRGTEYGHKLNLTTGKSGLVLDLCIEEGNPADTARLLPMIERQQAIYGRSPRQVAADGGYASLENVFAAKALGVSDIAFHKKRGLKVEEMTRSQWVYKKLCDFRAGIEGNISCLKRRYGLSRCLWKGLEKFKAYVWSSTVAYNFMQLARLTI